MKLLLTLPLLSALVHARTPIAVTDDRVRLADRRSRRGGSRGPMHDAAAAALPTLPACHREGYVALFTKHNATITPPEGTTHGTTHGTTFGKDLITFGQAMGESMQMLQLRVLLRSLRRHEHAAREYPGSGL